MPGLHIGNGLQCYQGLFSFWLTCSCTLPCAICIISFHCFKKFQSTRQQFMLKVQPLKGPPPSCSWAVWFFLFSLLFGLQRFLSVLITTWWCPLMPQSLTLLYLPPLLFCIPPPISAGIAIRINDPLENGHVWGVLCPLIMFVLIPHATYKKHR